MSNRNSAGSGIFIIGAFLGAIAGAFTALLLAPEKGDVTRRKLKKSGDKLLKHGLEKFDKFQEEQIEPLMEKAGEKADEVKTEIMERFDDIKTNPEKILPPTARKRLIKTKPKTTQTKAK